MDPSETPRIEIHYTDRQKQAYDALHRPDVRRLMYGGAKGGGKSFLLVTWAFAYALQVIHQYQLQESNNPPHIGWLGRKQAVDFAGTTMQTWRENIPESAYVIRSGSEKDPKHFLIYDTVAIDFGGLDKQVDINKFNSAEYGFIGIDQAEETTKDDVAVIRGSLRMQIKGNPLPYKELYTANPRQCWLKDEFITEKRSDSIFIPALPKDNPNLPPDYEQTLIDAFGYRPGLLAAYLHGDWSQIEDEAQVILDDWLARAINNRSVYEGKLLCCDVARYGDDKTEIMYLDGTQIEHSESHGKQSTVETSDRLNELSRDFGDCPIVVDDTGVGGGVVDELHRWGRHVIPFKSAAKATQDKYYNVRAEAWWEASQDFAQGNIGCAKMGTELRKQLTIPRYELRNGKILIESKDTIKERMPDRRSPDKADCYIMGLWGLRRLRANPIIAGIGWDYTEMDDEDDSLHRLDYYKRRYK